MQHDIVIGDKFTRNVLITTELEVIGLTETMVQYRCVQPEMFAGEVSDYEIDRLLNPVLQWNHIKSGARP